MCLLWMAAVAMSLTLTCDLIWFTPAVQKANLTAQELSEQKAQAEREAFEIEQRRLELEKQNLQEEKELIRLQHEKEEEAMARHETEERLRQQEEAHRQILEESERKKMEAEELTQRVSWLVVKWVLTYLDESWWVCGSWMVKVNRWVPIDMSLAWFRGVMSSEWYRWVGSRESCRRVINRDVISLFLTWIPFSISIL